MNFKSCQAVERIDYARTKFKATKKGLQIIWNSRYSKLHSCYIAVQIDARQRHNLRDFFLQSSFFSHWILAIPDYLLAF